MDEIIIADKTYISSKQAAKITGYAKDYIGQLCREGRVEARLVGRNWYVLDSAIREHRFGKEEIPAPVIEPETAPDRISTWEKPQYEAEIPALVPNFTPRVSDSVGTPAIADMQSAWREWFEDKKTVQEPAIDEFTQGNEANQPAAPETIPGVVVEPSEVAIQLPHEEKDVEEVTISRIRDVKGQVESEEKHIEAVDIHRVYTPAPEAAYAVREAHPIGTRPAKQMKSIPTREWSFGNAVTRALLIVVSIAAILVALIGTGHADQYLSGTSFDFGFQNQLVNFLGGKSIYESKL
jgi:hypothetical protein